MADQRMMPHGLIASRGEQRLESRVRVTQLSEELLAVVRALAKRHAREDHAEQIAGRER